MKEFIVKVSFIDRNNDSKTLNLKPHKFRGYI